MKQYIGMNYIGEFCPTRQDFSSINPSNGEPIGYFPQSTQMEVDEAVNVANANKKAWSSLTRVQRAEYFWKLCKVVENRTEEITKAISLETGKSLNESRAEVIEALHMAQYCFGKGREASGEIVDSEIISREGYVIRKPKGVIAIVAPWNFPFAIGGFWCAGPSLLEGNTVVFKPSELTPMIGQITAELFQEAGFPFGVFNMIHGDGDVGAMLVKHPNIDHVAFTGSAEVGKEIRKVCAESWHKTSSCEMGSKSAVMVFEDADLEIAIPACINSAFKLSGQRCVSASRLLVQRSIFDKFVSKFVSAAQEVYVGDPFLQETKTVFSIGPLISNAQMQRVHSYNDMVRIDPDAQVVLDADGEGTLRQVLSWPGFYLRPFVYTCEWADKPYLKQEVFGPHVAIIPFDTVDDAIRIYNDTDYGLALGVITNDFRTAKTVKANADFGMGYWNGGSIAAESHFPFGGIKKSGNGFPSAAGMFDAVTHKIAWSVNYGALSFPQGLK